MTAVDPDSTAARLQLQQGDIIVRIEGVDIGDVEALKRVLGIQRAQWRVTVRRKDQILNVVVQG